MFRKVKGVVLILSKKVFRNKLVSYASLAILIAVLVIIGRFVLFSSKFDIKTIEIDGYNNVEKSFLDDQLSDIIGKNIFFIRASGLKEEVLNYSVFIKSVQVEKHLPDRINVHLEERVPYMVWINLSGCYLVDEEGFVLEEILDFKDLKISEEDVDLLKGYGNLKEYEDSIEEAKDTDGEDEQQNVDNEKEEDDETEDEVEVEEEEEREDDHLTLEERYAQIEKERKEVISMVDQFWRTNTELIPDKYSTYSYIYSYEQKDYQIQEVMDPAIISASKLCIDIDFFSEKVLKYIWESEYRFVLNFKFMRKIVFSTRRDFNDQIYDLKVLIRDLNNEGKNFTYIDLSSDILVYEFEE